MPVTGRRLVVWRHGRTEWNADGRMQGQLDPPLDGLGRRQAAGAAAVLADVPPTVVVSSDLSRARSTASCLSDAAGCGLVLDERLREMSLGAWEGLRRAEVVERFPEEYAAWTSGRDVRRGGGETYSEVAARVVPAVSEALDGVGDDGVLVVVTHGGTARALIGAMLEIDPASWWRFAPLGNCRWSMLVQTAQGWRLTEHNAGTPDAVTAQVTIAAPDVEAPDLEELSPSGPSGSSGPSEAPGAASRPA